MTGRAGIGRQSMSSSEGRGRLSLSKPTGRLSIVDSGLSGQSVVNSGIPSLSVGRKSIALGRQSFSVDVSSGTKGRYNSIRPIFGLKPKRRNTTVKQEEESRYSLSQKTESDLVEEPQEMKLEDQLTNERLQALEKMFEEANDNDDGGLDNDAFRRAMRQTMGHHLTDQEIDIMFMKVDTNCDLTVDWDEYLSYMLLEYREKDTMKQMTVIKPLPENIKMVSNMREYQRRHDTVVRLRHQPNIMKHVNNLYSISPDNGGKYISVSKTGVINFWSMELNHLRKHVLPPPKSSRKNIRLWVTDLVCAPNLNMIAVSSTAGTIVFYDLTAYSFQKVLTLADLEICVTCMDYWVDPNTPSRAKLVWGDTRGNIGALVFDECASVCFLQPTINKNFKTRVEFSELLKQTTCGVRAYNLPKVHIDLVIEIKYFHALNECMLSCCRGNTTSLHLGDIARKKSSYFNVIKGVQSFDYSATQNIIVTGGKDSLIRVWNPYVPSKPVMVIQGTKTAISHVFLHEEGEYIFSISQDKEIHIFDMNTQVCIQNIPRKNVSLGKRPITAATFNTGKQALVLGNNRLAMFEKHVTDLFTQQLMSQSTSVSHILYNELFDQVVSGSVDSLVIVWDAENGERVIQFVAHKIPLIGGSDIQVEITAMRFDPSQRRLITSARDGLIKIWNHNNGGLLRSIKVHNTNEIVGIVCPKQRIMTAGWNRRITVYVDDYKDNTFHEWQCCHKEDITAMCFKAPNIIATASYDGDILIWMIETGHVTLRFNAHIGVKPISRVQTAQEKTIIYQSPASSGISIDNKDRVSDVTDDEISDEEENLMLKQFMSYNTHRASIAAEVPLMSRRQSDLKNQGNKRLNVTFPTRLETISSTGEDILEESEDSHENLPSFSDASINPNNMQNLLALYNKTCNNEEEFNENNNSNNLPSNDEGRCQYDLYIQKNESSILKLLFLNKRESDKGTATLVSASTGGWIRFWVVEHTGGLVGQYNAAHHPGESVQCICVDTDNEFLFTGDTEGYVKVWDITEYCITAQKTSTYSMWQKKVRYEKFPIFQHKETLNASLSKQSHFRPPPMSTNPDITWIAPEILNSFKGHMQGITGIAYIDSSERLVTSSTDCSIRMWSVYGQFIGIFGQETPWQPLLAYDVGSLHQSKRKPKRAISQRRGFFHAETDVKIVMKCKLPADIRSVASATTLRIFNGGIRRQWKLLRNVVLLCLHLMKRVKLKRKILPKKQLSQALYSKTENIEHEYRRRTPDLDLKTIRKELENISQNGIKSKILGKSYKAQMKHKQTPVLPKLRLFQSQCDAYASLPFYELAQVSTELKPPPTIIDIQERQPNFLNLHTRFGKQARKIKTVLQITRRDDDPTAYKRRLSKYNRASSVNMTHGSKNDDCTIQPTVAMSRTNKDLLKLPRLECEETICG